MTIPVRTEDICAVLEPLLGTRFVLSTPLCSHAADLLCQYAPARMTLHDVFAKLRESIFGDLYDALGPGLVLTLESGIRLRLRLRDVDTLADEALGVLLDTLSADILPLEQLRIFALDSGLLCGLRVLLQRYGSVLPSLERETLIRIVKENHPADRYASWLD